MKSDKKHIIYVSKAGEEVRLDSRKAVLTLWTKREIDDSYAIVALLSLVLDEMEELETAFSGLRTTIQREL